MRNIWRIFRDDLRYAKSSLVAILVVLALCLVPVMYAWFNIAGSWDPYGNTSQLKVAVANSDDGYESALSPLPLNIGDRVVGMLHENQDYGWVFVDEAEAMEGMRAGRYFAAIVIPNDFSSKMMSVLASDAEQASVDYYLNMKVTPLAPIIAEEDGEIVVEDIRQHFTEAVNEMAVGLASDLVALSTSDSAREFGTRFVARLDEAATSLDAASAQTRTFSSLVDAAEQLVAATANSLKGSGQAVDASDSFLATVSEALKAAVSAAQTAATDVRNQMPSSASSGSGLSGSLAAQTLSEDMSSVASSVDTAANQANTLATSLKETVASLLAATTSSANELTSVRDSLNAAANKLSASASKVRKLEDDIARALARGNLSEFASIVGGNRATAAQWLIEPVTIERHTIYSVENYGSSIAPFYTVFSLWLGAVLLVALMKTSISRERLRRYEEQAGRPVKNYEQYLGRYLIFLLLSLVQATVVGLGDVFFLRVQCAHPILFMAACWVCALVFSNVVYTLAVSFGQVGKALCILLLIMQVVGAGGEFPIQMTGDFFQVAYLFLPATHGVHALQASVAGLYGAEYPLDLLKLAAFLVPSLLLGLALRRPVMRCADFFGAKLEQTGLM